MKLHILVMSNDNNNTEAGAQRRFKYTRELIKIAREDMTQEEISRACRVSQSVVSGWANGTSRAKEHQIAELLRRYGHRLNRTTSKVYLALCMPPTSTNWEVCRMPAPSPVVESTGATRMPWEELAAAMRPASDTFSPAQTRIVQVEGPITLRHTMHTIAEYDVPTARHPNDPTARQPLDPAARHTNKVKEREPVFRWTIHHQGRDRFVLVRQRRRALHEVEPAVRPACERVRNLKWVQAADDSACWMALIDGPLTADALLALADAEAAEPAVDTPLRGAIGAKLLPFLVRKMLVELGYTVAGVERMAASG